MQLKKIVIAFVLFIILSLTMLSVIQCTEDSVSSNESTFKIGMLIEDPEAAATGIYYRGAALAVSEINAAGGIDGKMIELEVKDAYGTQGTAGLTAVQEFHDAGVDFLIGPMYSSIMVLIAENVVTNNMLLMGLSTTSPAITSISDNNLIWRTCLSDAYTAKIAANYMYDSLNAKKVSIIYQDDSWGAALEASFKANFTTKGGTAVASIGFDASIQDYSTYSFAAKADSLMTGSPEIIFVLSYSEARIKFLNDLYLNSAYQTNPPKLFTVESFTASELLAVLPTDIVNNLWTIFFTGDTDANSNLMKYYQAHITKYPNDAYPASLFYYVACAYDAVYLMAYAMAKAGSTTDPQLVAAQLKNVSGGVSGATVINVNEYTKAINTISGGGSIDYNGASSNINFDTNGDVTSGLFMVLKIENSTEKVVTYLKID